MILLIKLFNPIFYVFDIRDTRSCHPNPNPIVTFFHHAVLSKLLTSLSESENKISGEQELEFLQSLLQSKELNALVNVHHKVAKLGKDDRIAPVLSASMQVICSKITMNS